MHVFIACCKFFYSKFFLDPHYLCVVYTDFIIKQIPMMKVESFVFYMFLFCFAFMFCVNIILKKGLVYDKCNYGSALMTF